MADGDLDAVWRELGRLDQATTRELTRLDQALRDLNDHGSRGVIGLQGQVTELAKDLTRLEAGQEAAEQRRRAGNRFVVASVLTLLLPVYAAIILAVIRGVQVG